jgi:three-Cys-motif partner protein
MPEMPVVGPWAREKLDALTRYLDFYTKVLKNQPWRTIYLDAYAGGGRAVVRAEGSIDLDTPNLFNAEAPIDEDARELIDGSPRVALGIVNPFDRYIFVEPNPERANQLESLQAEYGAARTIDIRLSNAAEGIGWVTAQLISRRTHRGIAFLDPFGADLDWVSIQKLGETGLFEVFVNFALGMARQRMLPNSGEVPDSWAARLDRYFGNRDWFGEAYKRRDAGLFAEIGYEKRSDYSERLLNLYRGRLRSVFGHVSSPRLIRNTRGTPLYYILWAGPHKKGLEGAEHILSMGDRVKRRPGALKSE